MRVNREVGRDVPFLGHATLGHSCYMPVNQVIELVHKNATDPTIDSHGSPWYFHTPRDTREEIRIINHLEPTIISHADASSRNGATSTLINASRKRSEERLIRKEPVRVHVEVESGLWCSRRHYGPPESGSSRPYTHIILNSGQEIKN